MDEKGLLGQHLPEAARVMIEAAQHEQLRDTFASAALQGLLVRGHSYDTVVEMAYTLADEMLRRRVVI